MATEHRFYHLTRTSLDAALPRLVERVRGLGQRCLIVAPTRDRVEALDLHLWTYDADSFLAHGSAAVGYPADQPVWLTHVEENPNAATALFLVDGAEVGFIDRFSHCLDLFDGRDEVAVAEARERWRAGKSAGRSLKYFKQTERGWEAAG